jgi:hypothetical protein
MRRVEGSPVRRTKEIGIDMAGYTIQLRSPAGTWVEGVIVSRSLDGLSAHPATAGNDQGMTTGQEMFVPATQPSLFVPPIDRAHDAKPGILYQDDKVKATAFPVRHGEWPQAFGYRFDTPGRSIVISGTSRL